MRWMTVMWHCISDVRQWATGMTQHLLRTVTRGLLLCVAGLYATHALPEQSPGREEQMKAAYLLNFAKFVEWPNARPDQGLTACFIGSSAVGAAFAAGSAGKKVSNRAVIIRYLESTQATDGCDIIFIDAAAMAAGKASPATSEAAGTLTVSDVDGFLRKGGMIELFADSNRLRFRINLGNAIRAGLRIRSDLLQLAASVDEGASQ
jgi:hypothetical protein